MNLKECVDSRDFIRVMVEALGRTVAAVLGDVLVNLSSFDPPYRQHSNPVADSMFRV